MIEEFEVIQVQSSPHLSMCKSPARAGLGWGQGGNKKIFRVAASEVCLVPTLISHSICLRFSLFFLSYYIFLYLFAFRYIHHGRRRKIGINDRMRWTRVRRSSAALLLDSVLSRTSAESQQKPWQSGRLILFWYLSESRRFVKNDTRDISFQMTPGFIIENSRECATVFIGIRKAE